MDRVCWGGSGGGEVATSPDVARQCSVYVDPM